MEKDRKHHGSARVRLAAGIAALGILIALLVILVLLLRWNKGTKSTFDADNIETAYETE